MVKRSLEEDYMTLSYVWGSGQALADATANHFWSLNNAPLTVRDAVHVVRSLDKRYLWVDRYCIDQDNVQEKALMLQPMDLIYEGACATIVALYGKDDEAGLPGVSTTLRTHQPSFKTNKGCLIWSYPSVVTMVANSKWNTRGWTYQEARLSRCCIFFSIHQVYCVCRQSTWSEAVPLGPSSTLGRLLNSARLDESLFGDTSPARDMFSDRLQCTKRLLTYDKDGLVAFQGVLRRSDFVTLWGIPLMLQDSTMDANLGFALGLLWSCRPDHTRELAYMATKKSGKRRDGFLTWCWASVDAQIGQYQYAQSVYWKYVRGVPVEYPHIEAPIRVWLLSDGGKVALADYIKSSGPILPYGPSQQLLIEGDLVRVPYASSEGWIDRWYRVDTAWAIFNHDEQARKWDDASLATGPTNEQCKNENEDWLLVLIQPHEARPRDDMRLMLMVLN